MEGRHTFESSLEVNAPVEILFSWHENPGAFERLTPSFDPVTVSKRLGNGIDGGEVHIKLPFVPLIWVAKHHSFKKNVQFMEDQISGPFVGPLPFWKGAWHHKHLFEKIDNKNASSYLMNNFI